MLLYTLGNLENLRIYVKLLLGYVAGRMRAKDWHLREGTGSDSELLIATHAAPGTSKLLLLHTLLWNLRSLLEIP